MLDPMISVLGVMVFAGLLGGVMNFFLTPAADAASSGILKSVTIGIGASMLVPLFLNMISSGIIDQVLGAGKDPPDTSKLLVLTGFCLVAAISSRAFIETLSQKVMNAAKEAQKLAQAANERVRTVEANVELILDKETEEDTTPEEAAVGGTASLAEADKKVLEALRRGAYTFRSVRGIAADAGVAPSTVMNVLPELKTKALVADSPGQKGAKWHITRRGRAALEASVPA